MDPKTARPGHPTVCTRCGAALTLISSALLPEVREAVCDQGHEIWEKQGEQWTCRVPAAKHAPAPEVTTRQRDQLLARLVRHLPDAVILTDAAWNVIECGPQLERTYGWTRDDTVGKNLLDLGPALLDGNRDDLRAALAAGTEARANVRAPYKDGRWADFDVVVTPFPDDAGRVTRYLLVARDVTEQREAVRALHQAHAQLAFVVEASGHGFFDWQLPSGHVAYSERCAEMLGYAAGELEPRVSAWDRLVHPDDRAPSRAAVQAHLDGTAAHLEFEQRLRHRDGHYVHVMTRGQIVVRDDDGRPLRLSGTITDVSARREADRRVRAYFDAPAVGIAIVGRRDHFDDANARFCEMLGYTREELSALTFAEVTHPDDRSLHGAPMQALFSGGTDSFTLEKRYVRKDGSTLHALMSVSAVRDSGGEVTQRIAVLTDVGALKQAERETREAKEQLALVVDSTNDGFFDWHVPTGHVYYSPRVSEIIGWEPQMLGTAMANRKRILHPDDEAGELASFQALLSGQRPQHVYEARVRHEDGHWVWVLIRAKVVERDGDGQAVRVVGTFADISARKAAETALRDALAANERLVGDLREALDNVNTLSGLLPICANCKRIRDEEGLWERIEHYISAHSDAKFTHGLCPDCLRKLYPSAAAEVLDRLERGQDAGDDDGWFRPK